VKIKSDISRPDSTSGHLCCDSTSVGVDYLLTWNYRHIDNAEAKPIIRKVCIENRYEYPEICTPQELMGVYENG
jgi:hypothetical protein